MPTGPEPDAPDDYDSRQDRGEIVPLPAVYPGALDRTGLDHDAVKVLRRLARNGHEAYLVGGGVRDLLLGRSPKDFDVATDARPQDVRRIFRNCRVIGRRFRLAHILFANDKIIECATFRRDPELSYLVTDADLAPGLRNVEPDAVRLVPDKRHHTEEEDLLIRHDNHFGDPHEDAIRRDFTINGLFYDVARDEVIDYVGGVANLHRRVVRTIGDPGVRFREDPVRILRAIKFSARLDLGIEPDVLRAMRLYVGELSRAASPRVLEELFRLMRGGAAHRSLFLMHDIGAFEVIVPEIATFLAEGGDAVDETWERLMAVDRAHARDDLPADAIMLAALLLGPLERAARLADQPQMAMDAALGRLSARLSIPRRMKEHVSQIIGAQTRLRSGKLGGMARREHFRDALLLHAIDCEAKGWPAPTYKVPPPKPKAERGDGPPRRRRRRRRRGGGGGG